MHMRLGSPMMADGGETPVLLSPGEKVLEPGTPPMEAARKVANGTAPTVPGKAKVAGNSPKNDTVRTELPVGSIVIPRSVTQAPDAPARTRSFVDSIMQRHGGGGGMAFGGVTAPGPARTPGLPKTPFNPEEGGMIESHHRMGRGLALDETRGRITTSKRRKYRDEG